MKFSAKFILAVLLLINLGCEHQVSSVEEDAIRRRERHDPLKSMVTDPIERANAVATVQAKHYEMSDMEDD